MQTIDKPWKLTIGIFLVLLMISELGFYQRFDRASAFLFGEQSCNLWLADEISHGKLLYRDVFSQDGAAPAYGYALVASVFGNTPQVYLRLVQCLNLLVALLTWMLLLRRLKPPEAFLFLILVLSYAFFYTGNRTAYLGMERLMLVFLALLWRSTGTSSRTHNALVGIVLAATQVVKFGGGIVAFLAWVLADLCQGRASWKDLLQRWFLMGAGYLAFTLVWARILLATLPSQIAFDVLWPFYMQSNYSIYHNFESRWPHWIGKGVFFAQQIEVLVAAVLVLGSIGALIWRSRKMTVTESEESGPFLFLGFFFLIGIGIYLKNVWHYYEYYWIVLLAAAWPWKQLSRWPRLGVTAIFLLGFVIQLHWMTKGPPPELTQRILLPSGEHLWATMDEAKTVNNLEKAVGQLQNHEPKRKAVFVIGLGAGLYHAFQWPAANRQSIWTMQGFIRPYDIEPMLDSLQNVAVVVVTEGTIQANDPRQWTHTWFDSDPIPVPTGLPEIICQELARKLGAPVQVAKNFYVYPVLSKGAYP